MSYSTDKYDIIKVCPYQEDIFTNPDFNTEVFSGRYLDPDDICLDIQAMGELNDSNGDLLEFYGKDSEMTEYSSPSGNNLFCKRNIVILIMAVIVLIIATY
jgi:hypothetical protein